jgi:AbrB family looped-hinge helix DNA binding protein
MKVTTKGQVTIPEAVRKKMGIKPHNEVEFVEDKDGRIYLRKARQLKSQKSRFRKAGELVNLTMSTDEIMVLTRG